MTLSEKQQLFAQQVAQLIEHINLMGYQCTLGEAYRTPEQAAIYAKEGKGIKDSLHCKRLAVDLNLFKNGVYLEDSKEYTNFGVFWERLDPKNRNGRNFPQGDANHFERME